MVKVASDVLRRRAEVSAPGEDAAAEGSSAAKEGMEVANGDLWTIHGARYDMRTFMDRHPGGAHALSLGRGIDCTTMFETYHPFSDKHRKVLARYKYDDCPELALVDDSFDWKNTPFYDELKQAARAYFAPRGDETDKDVQLSCKADRAAWFEHGFGMLLLAWAFYSWLRGAWGSVVYFPLVYWVVGSNLMHNGSHFAMSRTPWINTLSAYIGSFHIQRHAWDLQHVVGHHCHTNVLGRDPDLCHFAHNIPEEKYLPGFRVSRKQEYLPKYDPLWKFAGAYHLTVTTLATAMANFPRWIPERMVEVTPMPERMVLAIKRDRGLLLGFCVLFVVLSRETVGQGLHTLFWSWAVHGALFLIFSQISHVNEECMDASESYRSKHGMEKLEWARHQLLSAYDYSCDSKFWGLASINLNQQICHHLFPSIHPCHYPALRKLFMPIAAKYDIDYEGRSSDNFVQAVTKFVGWIKQLNASDEKTSGHILGIRTDTFWGISLTALLLLILLLIPAMRWYIL